MEEFGITGVTADKSKLLLKVGLSRPNVLGSLWNRAARAHLPIVAPVFFEGEVRFFSDRDGEDEWKKALEELTAEGFVKKYQICPDIIPLSVIGDRFSQDGAALHDVMSVLAREHIQVTLGSASSLAITVGVSANHAEDGVRALHAEFLEVKK